MSLVVDLDGSNNLQESAPLEVQEITVFPPFFTKEGLAVMFTNMKLFSKLPLSLNKVTVAVSVAVLPLSFLQVMLKDLFSCISNIENPPVGPAPAP